VDCAARLATDFVCIHPFEDGNGRLCRMILNVMSIKYAGCTVPIGVEEEEREEYLKEAWLANTGFTEEEKNDVEHSGREAHHGMGRSIVGKMSLRLSETKAKLMAKFG
jgi:fido (protein-threonine AMPylation protein)